MPKNFYFEPRKCYNSINFQINSKQCCFKHFEWVTEAVWASPYFGKGITVLVNSQKPNKNYFNEELLFLNFAAIPTKY